MTVSVRPVRFILSIGCVALFGFGVDSAAAQNYPGMPPGMTMPPGMSMPPGMPMPNRDNSRRRPSRQSNNEPQVRPPGVPISMDSPAMKSFLQLEQHSSYRMRMTINAPDPMMAQMMAQVGFGQTETAVSGDTKLVTMHMKLQLSDIPGQVDDWEVRSVARNGRAARMFSSPAIPRWLAKADAEVARQLAELDREAARTTLASLASGPLGWATAGMDAALLAAAHVEAVRMVKKEREFFQWQCLPPSKQQETVDRNAPPPLTDLNAVGDQTVDGVSTTAYEFYVHDKQKDEYHGPMRLHVAKDTQLPLRIEMTDPQMRGASMNMDYYDFDKVGEIEIPACLKDAK